MIFETKGKIEQAQFDDIKKFTPLDYFIINYSTKDKSILNIIPSCNLVKTILLKKSKNFASIIYQSDYYDKADQSEKGKILQNAIEERIKNVPSILLNFFENNLIVEIGYLIPTPKINQSKKNDPVERYYKAKKGEIKNADQNFLSYIYTEEKNDMEKLIKIEKEKSYYHNIIIIETDPNAKNYDMGILKFINDKQFIIVLFQITVSREKHKFGGINKTFEKDILYLTDKFEVYLLDKDDINNPNCDKILYKDGLNNQLKDFVFLIYYDRKYLHFCTEDGRVIKELIYKNENLRFITSDNHHYFQDENIIKIYDKIINLFHPSIGKYYIDNYDYNDVTGNYLILSKIDNDHITIVVNINGKRLHSFDIKNNIIKQVLSLNYGEKKSYYFEITNPKDISSISIFTEIDLNKL